MFAGCCYCLRFISDVDLRTWCVCFDDCCAICLVLVIGFGHG